MAAQTKFSPVGEVSPKTPQVSEDRMADYKAFMKHINNTFENFNNQQTPLFNTDAEDLFNLYIKYIPNGYKRYYDCNTCKKFFNTFGGLVTVDKDGHTKSVLWEDEHAPEFFKLSVKALKDKVKASKITSVFYHNTKSLGVVSSGGWPHFAITNFKSIHKDKLKTPFQKSAEKTQDFETISRALDEFKLSTLNTAIQIAKSEALYRGETILGMAKWLQELKRESDRVAKCRKNNVIWKAIATAPAGFCHPRSSVLGSLLEDIDAGYPFDTVKAKFDAKMNPAKYQRPQAAPTVGNINQAEKIFEKLNLKDSLKRRFAVMDDIQVFVWKTKPSYAAKAVKPKKGIFSNLVPETNHSDYTMPAITITMEKFKRTVLPEAKKIKVFVRNTLSSFTALVTAKYPDAEPILKWDVPEFRNPVSTYSYIRGSFPTDWALEPETFIDCLCIVPSPNTWNPKIPATRNGMLFVLAGAKDLRYTRELCLFPEDLKSELHPVRSTIEAYSKSGKLEAVSQPVCGLYCSATNKAWDLKVKVTTKDSEQIYIIDRWD